MNDLLPLLEPISRHVVTLDLSDTETAEASLNQHFPPKSEAIQALIAAAKEARTAGTICHRGEPGMGFSRVVKPENDVAGCSIDAVYMDGSSGPPHTHPQGEVCLCIPETDGARFEQRDDAWIILPPGSRHTPTVENGAMLILYWLPEGAVQWG